MEHFISLRTIVTALALILLVQYPRIFVPVSGFEINSKVCGADNIACSTFLGHKLFYINGDLVEKDSFCKALYFHHENGCLVDSYLGSKYCGLYFSVAELPLMEVRKVVQEEGWRVSATHLGQDTPPKVKKNDPKTLSSPHTAGLAAAGIIFICCSVICPCIYRKRKASSHTVLDNDPVSIDSASPLDVNPSSDKVPPSLQGEGTWIMEWNKELSEWEEESWTEIKSLCRAPRAGDDKLQWSLDRSGHFTSSSCYRNLLLFKSPSPVKPHYAHIWQAPIPFRITVFMWLLMKEKINTRSVLVHRHMLTVQEGKCKLCDIHLETIDHLFLSCNKSAEIWVQVFRWMGIVACIPDTVGSLWNVWASFSPSRRKEHGDWWALLFYAIIWWIWKSRNAAIFKDAPFDSSSIWRRAMVTWYFWLKSSNPRFAYTCADIIRSSEWITSGR